MKIIIYAYHISLVENESFFTAQIKYICQFTNQFSYQY